MRGRLSENELEIYDAHISILEDPELIDKTIAIISTQHTNADFALHCVAREYIELLEQLQDTYLSARAKDIDEVSIAVIEHLQGKPATHLSLSAPMIIVADKISTYQISTIDTQFVLGVITAQGGATDHSSILYNALGIPAIVGVGAHLFSISKSDTVLLDAEEGTIEVNPGKKTLEVFQKNYEAYRIERDRNLENSHLPAKTLSGKRIKVYANIGDAREAKEAVFHGADGIGLLRTEFCFLNRKSLPDEEEQYEMYKAMLDELPGKKVVVRLIDIGSDKKVPYIDMGKEENPALGIRALRLGFKYYDALLRPQIRALLRLSVTYDIQFLLPMIATPHDLKAVKDVIQAEKIALESDGIQTHNAIPLGIMVEIPNVALLPELFVDDVDFFSFGTNDLAQYLMAADRGNSEVSHYLPEAIPAVLKLLKNVAAIAHAKGKWVGICGALATDLKLTRKFIEIGIDELSMPSAMIPKMKAFIRKIE